MNIKDELVNQIVISLSSTINPELLGYIKNQISMVLINYDVSSSKNLPSNEVINYEFIVKHFLSTKRIEGVSPNTLESYTGYLNRFFSDTTNQIPIREITTNHIRRYLSVLGNTGVSMGYVDTTRIVLNIFFTFCQDEEYVVQNPVKKIKKIKQKKTIEMPFSDMETARIKQACKTSREKALIDFLLSTGVRREEVVKITMSDIDFSNRSVLIHGKGNKDRMVYFSAQTELSLKNYLSTKPAESQYLFGKNKGDYGQMTVSSLRDVVVAVAKRSGVANVHLHRFRKTFATYMVNHGVPIQDLKEMLGHSSIDTTNTYYAFANIDHIGDTHRRFAI